MLVQSLPRLEAKKLTLLLHAACCTLVHLATAQQQGAAEALGTAGHSAMWAGLLTGIERGWRQLDLTHRRMLLASIIYLQDKTAVQVCLCEIPPPQHTHWPLCLDSDGGWSAG